MQEDAIVLKVLICNVQRFYVQRHIPSLNMKSIP